VAKRKRRWTKVKSKKAAPRGKFVSPNLVEFDGEILVAKEVKGTKLVRTDTKPKSGPGSGSVVLSVLCIISVVVLIPMAVGGVISLIVALAGEDEYKDFPDDVNGFLVINSSTTSTGGSLGTSGVCTLWTNTPGSIVTNEFGLNWTQIADPAGCLNAGHAWINIQIPSSILPQPDNFTFSRFDWDFVSVSQYNSVLNYTAHYNMTLSINGTEIFTTNEQTATHRSVTGSGSTQDRYWLNGSHNLNAIDEFKYRESATKCHPNCYVLMNISGYTSDVVNAQNVPPFDHDFKMNLQTYTTDIDLSGVILTIMPYGLGIINLLIALAATPLWDPISKKAKKVVVGV